MNVNQMIMNLRNAMQKLIEMRLVVSASSGTRADLPLLVIIIAALMAPRTCAVIAVLALVTRHSFRVEKDVAVHNY